MAHCRPCLTHDANDAVRNELPHCTTTLVRTGPKDQDRDPRTFLLTWWNDKGGSTKGALVSSAKPSHKGVSCGETESAW